MDRTFIFKRPAVDRARDLSREHGLVFTVYRTPIGFSVENGFDRDRVRQAVSRFNRGRRTL